MKKKRVHPVKPPPPVPSKKFHEWKTPLVVAALGALFILGSLYIPRGKSEYNLRRFGELPVLSGGRLKPIDTLARSSLLVLSGKQTVKHEGEKISAVKWFVEMISQPSLADERPVFRIDDPDVLGLMGFQQTSKRNYSFAEIHPHLETITQQATQAAALKADQRSRFQGAVIVLHTQADLYNRIQNTFELSGRENVLHHLEHTYSVMKALMAAHLEQKSKKFGSDDLKGFSEFVNQYSFLNQMAEFFPMPVNGKEAGQTDWISPGQAMLQSVSGPWLHPGLVAYASMADAIRSENPPLFNRSLSDLSQWLELNVPDALRQARLENRFNHAAPFYRSIILYFMCFLLVMVAWLTGRDTLQKSGYALLILTFVVHTAGLLIRMKLHGRPPVTNLYSSAIFVGWVAVLLGILVERFSWRGIGTVVSALIGFITLIIAHNLSVQGDTLEMMRAVLDSNFWLATHVVAITIGYASTFLAGTIGIIYIVRRQWDRGWNDELGAALEKMAYGVVCFSLFFSFTGTILGGIWADQSWGRFWGWDPKENGALMIVLWNAFILHARWSKVAGERGIMAMTVFGNVVTALSWFGVNMLGIGLHSYGFMDKAFFWLMGFVLSQTLIIGLAYIFENGKRGVQIK